jgi:DNA-binding NarL/FixJ family response regulator
MSAPGNLHGLNRHDLEIIGLLIDDWPDHRIGAALDLPISTVADKVEHILTKLAAPTRPVAVLRALGQGLYIPRPLISA